MTTPPETGPLDDRLAHELARALAGIIDQHLQAHTQSSFVRQTGITRSRVHRLRSLVRSGKRHPGEMRFSVIELVRIADALGYGTVGELVAKVERQALQVVGYDSTDARRRHLAAELSARFLRLSDDEIDSIQLALDVVRGRTL